MVTYWFNDRLLDQAVRLNGVQVVFRVGYSCGVVRDFSGRMSSLVWLRRALRSRLSSDSSLWLVQVFLHSGVVVAECSRRSRP